MQARELGPGSPGPRPVLGPKFSPQALRLPGAASQTASAFPGAARSWGLDPVEVSRSPSAVPPPLTLHHLLRRLRALLRRHVGCFSLSAICCSPAAQPIRAAGSGRSWPMASRSRGGTSGESARPRCSMGVVVCRGGRAGAPTASPPREVIGVQPGPAGRGARLPRLACARRELSRSGRGAPGVRPEKPASTSPPPPLFCLLPFAVEGGGRVPSNR